jgi:hypothetical protein
VEQKVNRKGETIMRRQLISMSAAVALLAGWAVSPVLAQFGQPYQQQQLPGAGLGYRGPNVSPYALSTPGAQAYPWAQNMTNNWGPQAFGNQLGMLQQQSMMNSAGVAGLQQQQLAMLAGVSGHPVRFLSYRQYFLNMGGQGAMGGLGGGLGHGSGMAGAGMGQQHATFGAGQGASGSMGSFGAESYGGRGGGVRR